MALDPGQFALDLGESRLPQVLLPSPEALGLVDGQESAQRSLDLDVYTKAAARSVEGDALSKALTAPPSAFSFANMSYMPDPQAGGLISWPGIPPESIQRLARTNLIPEMIIGQRIIDVLRYSTKATHPWRPGWRIELRDASKQPTRQDKMDMRAAESFIENCNVELDSYHPRQRDAAGYSSFRTFLSRTVRDFLMYDSIAIWTDMDRASRVKAWNNLPAGNIRLADPRVGYRQNPAWYAVLVDQGGTVKQAFTRDELTWHVGNPRTDPDIGGYGWSRIEVAMRLIESFQNALDMNSDVFTKCFSEDTEILTQFGWKTFDQVDISKDLVATLNPETGVFEYQQPTDRTWQVYEGDMYRLHSRAMDFLVTPHHRIVTQYRPTRMRNGRAPYELTYAKDLYERFQDFTPASRKNYGLPKISKWVGVEIADLEFEFGPTQYKNPAKKISGDDYCAFMGMYLSEGNLARDKRDPQTDEWNNIVIHQREYSKGFLPFKELIERITGVSTYYTGNWWKFGFKGLARHLRQFGSSCYDKSIPKNILNATPRQQKIFWDYFVLGDGSTTGNKTHATTTSKVMADQLQELLQKMGFSGTICAVDATKYACELEGRIVRGTTTRYDIYKTDADMNSMDMEKTTYSGHVGCVTVPNGIIYVRRHGKAIWSGNSGIPMGMILLQGMGFTQNELDAITRQWQNLKKGASKVWALPAMVVPKDSKVEFLNLSAAHGQDAMYVHHMNLVGGVFCSIMQFPHRRLGWHLSGGNRDSEPFDVQAKAMAPSEEEDVGLISLFRTLEEVVNSYLLWTRWPHLQLNFTGKSPREDAREYEARQLARTWGERRAEVDLPKLETLVTSEDKETLGKAARLMELCPSDPGMMGVFQAIAKAMLGGEGGGDEDGDGGGAMFPAAKDPASGLDHGQTAGVRRHGGRSDSRKRESVV